MNTHILISVFTAMLFAGCSKGTNTEFDVIIAGGGASGIMAAIQAARMDKTVLIIEETEWLGGMITAAGVSAIDGNYELPSGLWEEFRQRITAHYGGPDSVKTGWVSNVLFEPNVAAALLDTMVAEEEKIEVLRNSVINNAIYLNDKWEINIDANEGQRPVSGQILIDATELGDIVKLLQVPHDIGMDSRYESGENIAPEQANEIIQDLTYVAVLEKMDSAQAVDLIKPEGYDPLIFRCTCAGQCNPNDMVRTLWPCDQMMEYGKLPNEKIMINWPINGNDYYANTLDLSKEERDIAFEKAKNFTKCYIYYLQTELGFHQWRIAKTIFPTDDGFPIIPYHRESRRINGLVKFDLNDLAQPYNQQDRLYKTGIAVGDYPIDHHHAAYPDTDNLPDLHFYPVPSYTIPLGVLIPKNTEGLIVAEKSISVTHIVNGTTRLQPVCMLIGQAAGALAAISIDKETSIKHVQVRDVQSQLLQDGAFIMPYADVAKDTPGWSAIQRIGATGIIRGEGKNVGWRNYTFFHPDSIMNTKEFIQGLIEQGYKLKTEFSSEKHLTLRDAISILESTESSILSSYSEKHLNLLWNKMDWRTVDYSRNLTRKEVAVLLDYILNPFEQSVDHMGFLLNNTR